MNSHTVSNIVDTLLHLSWTEIDARFRESSASGIPDGDASGYALIATNSFLANSIAKIIRLLVWQGKIFDRKRGILLNKLTPFGIRAIRGRLYNGPSRFDGRECIVLDYSKTSLVACWIRDELRELKHPLYLGKVYVGSVCLFHFTLEFSEPKM